jgi:tRNA-2-methylthio-N6-dimethylallyladenosine synthase
MRLPALLSTQQRAMQEQMVGREVDVLFERSGRMPGQMVGKSGYLHAVHVMAENVERGDIRKVKIVKSETNSLEGQLSDC